MKLVDLVIGFISQDIELMREVSGVLSKKFGELDFESEVFDFLHTDYYEEELGKNLKRKFISFKELINVEEFVDVKLYNIELEKYFSVNNKRRINIDPGYICASKLVLATTKNYYHRIYLKDNIYAEVTLYYKRREGFVPFPWTYPDYKTQSYINTFNKIRELYMKKIKILRSI